MKQTARAAFFKLQNPQDVILVSLLLFVVTVCVFMPSLQGDFLFYDENAYLLFNSRVNSGLSWANVFWAFSSLDDSNWHPLTWLSHMLDVQLYGLQPWGHHLTNVLLHAFNTVLVFLVFRRMTGAGWRSLIVAGLFGLHPLRVESVAWISERKDVLSTLFWLSAMWTYVRFSEEARKQGGKSKWFYGLIVLFFVMGLMSKAMLVTLPFVFLLLDYWPLNRWPQKSKWSLVREKIPFFLLAIIVSAVAYIAQLRGGTIQEMGDLSFTDRLGNAAISYVRYLEKFMWPENLCIFYPHPGHWPLAAVLAAILFLGLISGLVLWLRRPYLFVGWLWYLGTMLPVIGLVQLCSQSIADRYTYVPLIGVYVLLVWGVSELMDQWRQQRTVATVTSLLALGVYATLTRHEIDYWKDGETVWSRAIAVTKNNYVAHNNLGMILWTKDSDRAFAEFQEAVKIHPAYAEAQRCLAFQLLMRGRFDEAIVHDQAAWQANPRDSRIQFDMSGAYFNKGNIDEAIARLQMAYAVSPDSVQYQNGLGHLLLQTGRLSEAIPFFRKVALVETNNPEAFNGLGYALAKYGQFDEAISNFQKALSIQPDYDDASQNLHTTLKLKQQRMTQTNQPPGKEFESFH